MKTDSGIANPNPDGNTILRKPNATKAIELIVSPRAKRTNKLFVTIFIKREMWAREIAIIRNIYRHITTEANPSRLFMKKLLSIANTPPIIDIPTPIFPNTFKFGRSKTKEQQSAVIAYTTSDMVERKALNKISVGAPKTKEIAITARESRNSTMLKKNACLKFILIKLSLYA
ncbi:MAG: hypothetical protein IM593_17885 [Pseudanabaena sp. M125S2SP2A07QC]|nr:hypothetical protein [Pseudanabaena sp. M125S2SP2A07QC]